MIDEFNFRDGGAVATGTPMEISKQPRFKIYKGSTALKHPTRSKQRYSQERQKLLDSNVLSDHPSDSGLLIFTDDYEANSASMAAGVISGGGNFSGPEKWFERISGEALKNWLIKRL